jgi:hypothetical protein
MLEILLVCCAFSFQPAHAQADPRVPQTIEAVRDVILQHPPSHPLDQHKPRGVLDAPNVDPITIKKGKRFVMVEILEEGGCTIEFERRQYDVSSCWWLSGFWGSPG